jgi:AcrR family transcriptional regulator
MVRAQPSRLSDVAEAATRVFGRQGFRRTRMAEVATEAGLSAGAVYTYVESKEALFQLVFAHAFGVYSEGTPSLPLPTPAAGETVELIATGLRSRGSTPHMKTALTSDSADHITAELSRIVEERYDLIAGSWRLLAVIERSARDLPELADFYYRRGRRGQLDQLRRYLEARAEAGQLRPIPDSMAAARMVTEMITWFAWHRHEDPDAETYDEDRARRSVVEFVCDSLIEADR